MRYIVMECRPGYAVLLDEEGRFLKAANLHYETGQTVYDPVLLKETGPRQKRIYRWAGGLAAAAACFLLWFGMSYYSSYLAPYSAIYLSINPEVKMELNRKGTVVTLEGTNEDGKILLEGYSGKGKDKNTVTGELLDRAIEMGFLSEGGRISFSIDAPDELLFQEYGLELRTEVENHLGSRITVEVEIVDYSQSGQTTETVSRPAQEEESVDASEPAAVEGSDYSDSDYGEENIRQDETPPAAEEDSGSDYGSDDGSSYGSSYSSDYGSSYGSSYGSGYTDYDPGNS